MNSKKKSVFKSITWRIVAVSLGFSFALIFGMELKKSMGFTVTLNTVAMTLYYLHERLWEKV